MFLSLALSPLHTVMHAVEEYDLYEILSEISKGFKAVLLHATEAPQRTGDMSSYSSLISVLDGDEWSESGPGNTLTPGKVPTVSTGQKAGLAPE